MVELNRVAEIIEMQAPLETQEGWDNSGWQICLDHSAVSKVLVCLELNEAVAEEAISMGADCIVCHHPLIFRGIKSVDHNEITGKLIIRLIQKGVSVYATHTPFDKCAGGNNDYLAKLLNLQDVQPIPGDETGICRMGVLPESRSVQEVLKTFCDVSRQDIRHYRVVGNPEKSVQRIGICTGAGSEFMISASAAGCDLYVTGDVKYHEAQHALELNITVADMGHFGSENIFTENMVQILKDAELDGVEIIPSSVNLNPFTFME